MGVAETVPKVRHDRAGPRRVLGLPARPAGVLLRLILAVLLIVAGGLSASAADVELKAEDSYGRMIVTFPDRPMLPVYKASATNGVLVLTFEEAAEMPVERVSTVLGRYVTIARADPQGNGARFALARGVQVNTMEAGNRLFIDFMPPGWTGPPPRLPDEIVKELAQRAADAVRKAEESELLRAAGTAAARLDIRIARGPTFSRFVFRWNIPFEVEFQRQDGAVAVSFNRTAQVDVGPLRAELPPFVDDIDAASTEGRTTILLSVQPVADVRAFRDENAYVVDVQGPINAAALPAVASAIQKALDPGASPSEGTERVSAPGVTPAVPVAAAPVAPSVPPSAPADPPADEGPVDENAAAPAAAPPQAALPRPRPTPGAAPAPAPTPVAAEPQASPQPPPAVAAPEPVLTTPTPPPVVAAAPEPVPTVPAQGEALAISASEPVASAELPDDDSGRMLADDVIRVEAKRIGRATRLVFPYMQPVGSALFTRGASLWLVFDDPAPIEAAQIQDALAGVARSIKLMRVGDARAVRIDLKEPLLATLNPDNTYWVVTIGDMVIEPTRPLPIRRTISETGESSLDVPFGPASAVLSIDDPEVGDRIMVVTGQGQPRGLIKPQSFAEVDALSSSHGLAFVPKVDDLTLSALNEIVTLKRPGGLSLSAGGGGKRAAVLDLSKAIGGAVGSGGGYIDFGTLETAPSELLDKRQEITMSVTQAQSKLERIDRWFELAKFHLANGLGAEAIGVLRLIADLAPEEASTERMAVISAGAEIMMGRPEDALKLLDRPEFLDSPDGAFWRSIALTESGDFARGHKLLPRGESVLGNFPPLLQKRFLLAGVRSSIELNDYGKARSLLSQIDPKLLTEAEVLQLDLLNARATDATGQASDAIEVLSKVVRSGEGPIAAEATYRLIQLQRREGLITLDQAVDRLEQLAVSWRGDEIEIDTLRSLGQLSIERGDYRRAFEVMRTAMLIAPASETTRLMNEEMQASFASLFLDGKADEMKPVEALALYYDYRELTPQGRRGDAMVRKLADRLIDVDLLDQAASLLTYQVDHRLRGAARAQVAADLAVVHLLSNRPDKALLALARTRQSELPMTIDRQRRSVEARALAETGKPDLALDLLRPLSGAEIEKLRAEILWDANLWADAGAQYERLLGNRWNDELPLSNGEQLDALKAGIAYTLSNDQLSTDRLRSKFAAKMAKTANGSAFETVTGPISTAGATFNEVVRSIAAVDSMQTFLSEYRSRYLELGTGEKPAVEEAPEEPSTEAPVAGTDAEVPSAAG